MLRLTVHDGFTGFALGEVVHETLEVDVQENEIAQITVTAPLTGLTAYELMTRTYLIAKVDIYDPLWELPGRKWQPGYFDEEEMEFVPGEFLNEPGEKWTTIFTGEILEFILSERGDDFPVYSLIIDSAEERLTKIVADNADGYPGRQEGGISLAEDDRGILCMDQINNINAIWANTWIRARSEDQARDCGTMSLSNVGAWKKASEVLEILASSTSIYGFPYRFRPTLDFDDNGLILAYFESGAGMRYRDRSDEVVFHKGHGLYNVESGTYRRSTKDYANRVIHPVAGANPYTVIKQEVADLAARGPYEKVIDDDVPNEARSGLANLYLQACSQPKESYEFEITDLSVESIMQRKQYVPFVDYDIGDWIGSKWMYSGATRIDGSVRVRGITISDTEESTTVKINVQNQ